jgi:hypothetical protein
VYDPSEPIMRAPTYLDFNGDGDRDPDEPVGYGQGPYGYDFYGVSPGTYTVRAVAPQGYAQTAPPNNGARTAVITGSNTVTVMFGFHDVVAPTAAANPGYTYDGFRRPEFGISFSEQLAGLIAGDFVLQNLTTGTTVPTTLTTVGGLAYVRPAGGGIWPDGNYRLTLPASAATDESGNPFAADVVFDFFVLSGDANHDRTVDLTDFTLLAANFNQTGRWFFQGNFDYDSAGNVDLTDFTILAANFNRSLPPPAAAAARIAPTPQRLVGDAAAAVFPSSAGNDRDLLDDAEPPPV